MSSRGRMSPPCMLAMANDPTRLANAGMHASTVFQMRTYTYTRAHTHAHSHNPKLRLPLGNTHMRTRTYILTPSSSLACEHYICVWHCTLCLGVDHTYAEISPSADKKVCSRRTPSPNIYIVVVVVAYSSSGVAVVVVV